MNNVISRAAVLTLPVIPKEHREYQTFNLDDAYEQGWNDLQKCIESLPPEPQRTGRWIYADTQCGIKCSLCKTPVDDFCGSIDYVDLYYEPNFCPNCGARMEEPEDIPMEYFENGGR